jgi:hypothetical protein
MKKFEFAVKQRWTLHFVQSTFGAAVHPGFFAVSSFFCKFGPMTHPNHSDLFFRQWCTWPIFFFNCISQSTDELGLPPFLCPFLFCLPRQQIIWNWEDSVDQFCSSHSQCSPLCRVARHWLQSNPKAEIQFSNITSLVGSWCNTVLPQSPSNQPPPNALIIIQYYTGTININFLFPCTVPSLYCWCWMRTNKGAEQMNRPVIIPFDSIPSDAINFTWKLFLPSSASLFHLFVTGEFASF